MDTQTLMYVMAAFVVISAIALLIQMGTMIAIYKTTKAFQAQAKEFQITANTALRKAETLIDAVTVVTEQGRKQISEVADRANGILDDARLQVAKVDSFLTDATGRARLQMDRAEMVLDDAMNRLQETVALVHGGIMRPLREVTGIAAGIRAAVLSLTRGGRPSVAQATSDEEMFI